jgi:hypothetical protein
LIRPFYIGQNTLRAPALTADIKNLASGRFLQNSYHEVEAIEGRLIKPICALKRNAMSTPVVTDSAFSGRTESGVAEPQLDSRLGNVGQTRLWD